MPTYDYECDACGHSFDKFQSITAPVVRKCPECGKSKVRRLVGAGGGILFKGSGFYQTDYRSESYRKAAASEKPPSASPTSEKSGSSEKSESSAAKPAEKRKAKAKD